MNRRDFLATGSVTIASLALASTAALELTSTSGMTGSGGMSAASKLCRATFAQCLDSVFELHHTILGPVNLTLSNLLDRTAAERNEQFTLIFHAPKNTERPATFRCTWSLRGTMTRERCFELTSISAHPDYQFKSP